MKKYYESFKIKNSEALSPDLSNKKIKQLVNIQKELSDKHAKIYLAGAPVHSYYTSTRSIFDINIISFDLLKIIPSLRDNGYMILGTNVNNGVDVRSIKVDKFALVMGNEGQGVKQEIQDMCDKNLYIKMNPDCESLNVGVATSILLYEINRSNYE